MTHYRLFRRAALAGALALPILRPAADCSLSPRANPSIRRRTARRTSAGTMDNGQPPQQDGPIPDDALLKGPQWSARSGHRHGGAWPRREAGAEST